MSSSETPPRAGPWLWLMAMAAGPGLALWAVLRAEPAGFVLRDELHASRGGAAGYVLGGAGLVLGLWWMVARRVGWRAGLSQVVGRWRWLAGLPLLPLLRYEPSGATGPLAPLLVVLCGGLAGWSAYACSDMSGRTWSKVQAVFESARACGVLLAVAGAGVLARLYELALLRHQALGSRVYDLGIYDNLLWNTLHGRPLVTEFVPGGNHLTAHVDPVLLLLAPIYGLAPGSEIVLAMQAVAVLSGAVPVFLIALGRLGRPWLALTLGCAYLLYPSVHGTILFDAHSLAFAAAPCLWALYFLERERWWGYAGMVALLLATREDLALWCCGLGLYAALGRGARRVGAATIAVALSYFVLLKALVQPEPERYARRYAGFLPDGEGGFSGVVASLLSNPAHAVYEVLSAPKLVFLAVLLAPLMLLPLLAGRRWWTYGFGLAFTLLASNTMNYYALSHYTLMLFPVLFAATPAAIDRAAGIALRLGGDRERALRGLGVAVLVASLLATLRLGALVENGSFRGSPHVLPYRLSEAQRGRIAWLRAVAGGIPATASVAASNHVGAHFSARDGVAMYPQVKDADWLVLHSRDLQPKGGAVDVGRFTRRGYVLVEQWEQEIYVLRRDAGR